MMTDLHAAIARCIEDPRDERPYLEADELCQSIWQWATLMGTTPWRYCWDRYCSCKIMLREWQPETLPFDVGDLLGPSAGGRGAQQ